ncbi:hypothetical protein SLEP1_g34583 [Rubroshorea leprosula]|uniref:Uncharacterized protein n=1 Tax=Rubroshorea leprosula TaxID=152421 RepID=A0AAV5KKF6_9ROSI|nr:hypothetical protein SLEP1_g34583 [Rubroshorea leprosula]
MTPPKFLGQNREKLYWQNFCSWRKIGFADLLTVTPLLMNAALYLGLNAFPGNRYQKWVVQSSSSGSP